jgi:hypothetical protein
VIERELDRENGGKEEERRDERGMSGLGDDYYYRLVVFVLWEG